MLIDKVETVIANIGDFENRLKSFQMAFLEDKGYQESDAKEKSNVHQLISSLHLEGF